MGNHCLCLLPYFYIYKIQLGVYYRSVKAVCYSVARGLNRQVSSIQFNPHLNALSISFQNPFVPCCRQEKEEAKHANPYFIADFGESLSATTCAPLFAQLTESIRAAASVLPTVKHYLSSLCSSSETLCKSTSCFAVPPLPSTVTAWSANRSEEGALIIRADTDTQRQRFRFAAFRFNRPVSGSRPPNWIISQVFPPFLRSKSCKTQTSNKNTWT